MNDRTRRVYHVGALLLFLRVEVIAPGTSTWYYTAGILQDQLAMICYHHNRLSCAGSHYNYRHYVPCGMY